MKKVKYTAIGIVATMMLITGCGQANREKTVVSSTEKITETEKVTETENVTETEKVIETENVTEDETEEIPSTDNGSGKVTLAFTGDIFFSDMLYGYYETEGVSGFLSEKVKNNLSNVDLYIADHEFVCSDRGEKADYQLYTFRAPSNREVIFKEMGADIVTLANNHTLDYGVTALQDTFALLDGLNIAYVGAGNNLKEAMEPVIREVNGKRIAVFAASRFVPQTSWYATETTPGLMTTYESTDRFAMLCDAIKEAKESCDYVIVLAHMGVEKQHTVEPFQKNVAYGYVDSGADLVVACHPHVLQGVEFYKGKPIAYSLSNFLFGTYHSDTMVLNVTINEDNSSSVNILPCSSEKYTTTDLTGTAAVELLDFIESISFDVEIDDNGNVTPKQ